jgi:hypothetical protein
VRKQEVTTGAMNDNEVVIIAGLEEDDGVLLIPPPNRDGMSLNRLPDSPVRGDSAATTGGDTALRGSPEPEPEQEADPAAESEPDPPTP